MEAFELKVGACFKSEMGIFYDYSNLSDDLSGI
jgi:hypothetical protein